MNRTINTLLVTGGCGFIGTNFIRWLFGADAPAGRGVSPFRGRVVNLDALTYAASGDGLADIEALCGVGAAGPGAGRYVFVRADIRDRPAVDAVFEAYSIDAVVHFAAESHVDRSISGPSAFMETNVLGTFNLLEAARSSWRGRDDALFLHISTDEVFGSLGDGGPGFTETSPYAPRSPYSASKAAADHLVRAWGHTYNLPVAVTNCSNNYGPWQNPEKFIPRMVLNMLEGRPLPVYGTGRNVRDWLHVSDHARALWAVVSAASPGASYVLGGGWQLSNLELLELLAQSVSRLTESPLEVLRGLRHFVPDRPGHDWRYAIDAARIRHELGWSPEVPIEIGLEETVAWCCDHREWLLQHERLSGGNSISK